MNNSKSGNDIHIRDLLKQSIYQKFKKTHSIKKIKKIYKQNS